MEGVIGTSTSTQQTPCHVTNRHGLLLFDPRADTSLVSANIISTVLPNDASTSHVNQYPQPAHHEHEIQPQATSSPVEEHPTYLLHKPGLNPQAPAFFVPEQLNKTTSKDNSRKMKGMNVNTTNQRDAELEFARYEVNTAQTRICSQETTINDLKFHNELLERRLEDLEKRQKDNVFNAYFPLHQNNGNINNQQKDTSTCLSSIPPVCTGHQNPVFFVHGTSNCCSKPVAHQCVAPSDSNYNKVQQQILALKGCIEKFYFS